MKKLKKQWPYHVMLIPGIFLVFIFSYVPLSGLIIAFQKYNPVMGFSSPFVGWDNFRYLFDQPNFTRTIWNTIYMSFFKILGGIIVPVAVSLLLNEIGSTRVKRTMQTLVYLPHFLSWVILAGVLVDMLSADGIINQLITVLGGSPVTFLSSPGMFPWTMIITDIWKGFGFGTVVYLAAITGIDPGLYEAANIDGASRIKQTLHITLPMLVPTIILMGVLALGNVMNAGFDQIFNMYAPVVYETGDIIDTYVYRMGIEDAQYSMGAAVGMFKSLVSCIFVSASYIMADRFAGYRVF